MEMQQFNRLRQLLTNGPTICLKFVVQQAAKNKHKKKKHSRR